MSIDFSPIRLLLVLGLLAGAVCFGYCLRALTSKAGPPTANWAPPPVVSPPRTPPIRDDVQWQPPTPQYRPAAVPAATKPAEDGVPAGADNGRVRLMVGELIGAYDTFEIEGVRIYLAQALKRAGVTKIEPAAGTRFDPDQHKSVATVSASSPDQHMFVAATDRPGWVDGDGVEIRQPEVTVYKWEGQR